MFGASAAQLNVAEQYVSQTCRCLEALNGWLVPPAPPPMQCWPAACRLPCNAAQLRAASHAWPAVPTLPCLLPTSGPHTLTVTLQGIETVGGVMTKLINRNTVIPTKKSQVGAG